MKPQKVEKHHLFGHCERMRSNLYFLDTTRDRRVAEAPRDDGTTGVLRLFASPSILPIQVAAVLIMVKLGCWSEAGE